MGLISHNFTIAEITLIMFEFLLRTRTQSDVILIMRKPVQLGKYFFKGKETTCKRNNSYANYFRPSTDSLVCSEHHQPKKLFLFSHLKSD